MGYIEGASREQQVMFPPTLDEYVGENNEVRAIAAFIEHLRFGELGFARSEPAGEGRPGYDPRTLLGIFVWGHLNRVRSSRQLERECGRCVELMWLSGRLQPDFKTLCRFRQENPKAISKVMVEFRLWCEGAGLYGKELVAIDGSKFKAVNSTQRNVTKKKLAVMIEREERAVEKYLADLEEADAEDEGERREMTAEELKSRIDGLGESLKRNKEVLAQMEASGERQLSLTDADARLMKTAKGTEVCYNVQAMVDAKHKLIVDVEVTNEAADQVLLPVMAQRAKEELGIEELTVVADGGYFSHEAIKACEDENITAFVPIREGKDAERRGLISREEFKYDEERSVCLPCHARDATHFKVCQKRYSRQERVLHLHDEGLWDVSAQEPMHNKQDGTKDKTLGPHGGHRPIEGTTRTKPGSDSSEKRVGRAPVWHHQGRDEPRTAAYERAGRRENRNETGRIDL